MPFLNGVTHQRRALAAPATKWSVTDFRGQLLVVHPDGKPVLLHVAANGEIGLTRLPMEEAQRLTGKHPEGER